VTPGLYLRLGGLILALAGAFAAGWAGNGWRLNAEHDRERLELAKQAARQLDAMTADRDAKAAALVTANDKHLAKLQGAQNETNRLRDCLRTGSCGLRIAATCPPAQGPDITAAPSVDSGTRAELTPDAESAYFTLRDGIGRTESKLAACQDELRIRAAPAAP